MDAPDSSLGRQVEGLSTFVQLEHEARQAEALIDLAFIMTNETHRLAPYRHAFLWGRKARLTTISGTARFERTAPMVRWLESLGKRLAAALDGGPAEMVKQDIDPSIAAGWDEWLPAYLFAIPLVSPTGRRLGSIAFARETPWLEGETVLLSRLAGAYAHAWHALEPKGAPLGSRVADALLSKGVGAAVLAAITGAMFIPVSQSALAPAVISATQPGIVSAPMDGVVKRFEVAPNQRVRAGDILFYIDDTNLRNRRDVARRSLDVANAEHDRVAKRAFLDPESKSQMAILQARVAQREAELAFTEEQLAEVTVRADRSGIVIFRDVNDWIGRLVGTGERVMTIADPKNVELEMQLPVDDLLHLPEGARVQLFLNTDPLEPKEGVLTSASYEAQVTDDGVLAYRLTARLADDGPPPRIGLKGTAKIFGKEVKLFWFLMRKPLSSARRWLGV